MKLKLVSRQRRWIRPRKSTLQALDVQQHEELRGWARKKLNLKEKKDYMR